MDGEAASLTICSRGSGATAAQRDVEEASIELASRTVSGRPVNS